jgi:hypothetical protein
MVKEKFYVSLEPSDPDIKIIETEEEFATDYVFYDVNEAMTFVNLALRHSGFLRVTIESGLEEIKETT